MTRNRIDSTGLRCPHFGHSAKFVIIAAVLVSFVEQCSPMPWRHLSVPSAENSQARAAVGPWLYLSLNSLAETSTGPSGEEVIVARRIEINWGGRGDAGPTDQVALHLGHPTTEPDSVRLATFDVGGYPDGRVVTDVQMPRTNYSIGDEWMLQRYCLGSYYGAYLVDDVIVDVACLLSEPTWMDDNKDLLGSLPIRRLLIPGTHDTGAYAEYRGSVSDNVVVKYVITQEDSLLTQLVHGIRYFDLRIGYYERDEFPFWLNHGIAKVNRFDQAMAEIVDYLARTDEVIIMDFHGFAVGFDGVEADARHAELIEYVEANLGDWMLPRDAGYEVTLNDVWSAGKKVIVTYKDDRHATSPLLWPGVQRQWGDTNDFDELQSFLTDAVQQQYSEWWTAAAELTPTEFDIVFDLLGGLRNAAQMVNGPVTRWVREDWAGSAVNIVASDFYMGTGVVQLAIEASRARALASFGSSRHADVVFQ